MGTPNPSNLLKQLTSSAAKTMAGQLPSSQTVPGHLADPGLVNQLWSEEGGYRQLFDSVRDKAAALRTAHAAQRAALPPMSEMANVARAATASALGEETPDAMSAELEAVAEASKGGAPDSSGEDDQSNTPMDASSESDAAKTTLDAKEPPAVDTEALSTEAPEAPPPPEPPDAEGLKDAAAAMADQAAQAAPDAPPLKAPEVPEPSEIDPQLAEAVAPMLAEGATDPSGMATLLDALAKAQGG